MLSRALRPHFYMTPRTWISANLSKKGKKNMHQASGSYSQSMKRLEKSIFTPTWVRWYHWRDIPPFSIKFAGSHYNSGWRNWDAVKVKTTCIVHEHNTMTQELNLNHSIKRWTCYNGPIKLLHLSWQCMFVPNVNRERYTIFQVILVHCTSG